MRVYTIMIIISFMIFTVLVGLRVSSTILNVCNISRHRLLVVVVNSTVVIIENKSVRTTRDTNDDLLDALHVCSSNSTTLMKSNNQEDSLVDVLEYEYSIKYLALVL